MGCIRLRSPDGTERSVLERVPYRLIAGEKIIGVDPSCNGQTVAARQGILEELGLGDAVKSMIAPVAKLLGKSHCAACEAKRVSLNAFGKLAQKHGRMKAMSLMRELFALAKEHPDAVAVKLREYLDG
jgi:hypothetical protein